MATAEDDRDLLEAWRAGDRGAGNEIFRRHFGAIYRFFRNKMDEGHRDLIQRTFLACVEGRDSVPDGVPLRAWLLGIAHNKLLHELRRRKRERQALSVEERSPASTLRSPSRLAALHQEQHLLLRALRTLPVDLQVALELHYWEEMGLAEIARIMAVPVGTVKSRLARARTLLEQGIRKEAASEEICRSTLGGLDRWARAMRDHLAEGSADEGDPEGSPTPTRG